MGCQIREHSDTWRFCEMVIPFLLESEAENCTLLGLVLRIAENGYSPISSDELEKPLLLTVHNGEYTDAIALQTLKAKMLVSRGSAEAMRLLAENLAARDWQGREIIGFSRSIDPLVENYVRGSGRSAALIRRLATFQLTAVR